MQQESDRAKLSSAKRALLERMRKRTAAELEPPLCPRTNRENVPLSFAQQRMWLIQQLNPHSHLYTFPRALVLRGRLDLDALEKALNSILRRHEVLRTAFPADDEGKPWQRVLGELAVTIGMTDFSPTPGARGGFEVEKRTLEFARQPFDLARAPLLRAHVFRLGADEHVLALAMHHIVGDGWASAVFFRELGELYKAHISGQPPAVPDLTVQYADYAIWQREWMQGAVLEKEIEFWRRQVEGAPVLLDVPTDRARREESGGEGGSCSFSIGGELTSRLHGLCRSEGTTLFPVMLVGLNVLMARWTGQYDQVIGTIAANRDRAEVENLIGCFMNFLPLRASVNSEESLLDLLQRTKRSVFESLAHQACPFEKIVEAMRPERSLNLNPLYNVMLLVQNFPEIEFRTEDLAASLLPLEHGLAVVDLRFAVEEKGGQLSITCEYDKSLFDRKTVELLLGAYEAVLRQMVATPQARVSEMELPEALIEQASHARERAQKQVLAIAATFTAEPVEGPLAFWMKELGIPAQVEFAPYNQVMQQLLDPSSLLSRNSRGSNILLLRLSDWTRFENDANAETAQQKIESRVREFAEAVKKIALDSPADLLVVLCPSERKFLVNSNEFVERMDQFLRAELASIPGVELITSDQILGLYPVDRYEDEYADKLGHIPYTQEFFLALGTVVARRIFARQGPEARALVLDSDSILSNLAEGDDGDGTGDAGREIQEFALQQAERGMLLCLYTRRAEKDVARAFALHPEMPLQRAHIVAERLAGISAGTALRELAEEIQLDLDNFVFLTADRDTYLEAQAQCPEAQPVLVPHEAAKISDFLRHLWVFDAAQRSNHRNPMAPAGELSNRIASELSNVGNISRAMDASRRERRSQAGTLALPRSPVEEMLSDIWAQLLKLDRVGIHDNFFALGGHSLLATQVVARVRRITGVELGLRAMFETPTVAGLARQIEAARETSGSIPVAPLIRSAKRDPLPLSFAQQRLWFLDQLEPGKPIYNLAQMFRMRGKLDVVALRRALNKIVERHESLRTTFQLREGEAVQVVAAELDLPLPITDLSELAAEEREAEAQKLALEEAQRPFRLASGPLIRAQLVELSEEDHVLVLTMHHIISDRWSMGLVGQELACFYRGLVAGETPEMPELPIQYADFALWQREWLRGEVLKKQLGYWKKQLTGAPAILELPTNHARPPVMSLGGATQSVILPRELVDRLTRVSRSEGVTLFMTLLAAFETLLERYSGQDDIVVGSPIAGRHFAEIEPLIGFFVNTLALRGNLSGDPTFRELLLRTREVCLEAYAHQDVPFERLVEALQPERSLSHNPIFQVMFALQNAPLEDLEMPGLRLERGPIYNATSMFDMSWFAVEHSGGLMIRAEYSTDLLDDRTITRALGHFERLLESAVENPGESIRKLEMLTEEERRQLVIDFNSQEKPVPGALCVHQWIERTAAEFPDSTALIFGTQRASYRELNERANQIARYLIRQGAGRNVLVGVFFERTLDLIPVLLGILKSGSAYVPLDPSYPRERVGAILLDARAPMVLTKSSLAHELANIPTQLIPLDTDGHKIAREAKENPGISVRPEDLAYVLFTSGSTGRPKGVAIEHRSAATLIEWAQTVFSPDELEGVLFSTSVCFDLSIFEMFVPLSVGGKVILVQNALALPETEARNEVTLINTVPSAIAELIRTNGVPPSVKTINLAGEALALSLVNTVYSRTSAEKLYNLYGPTEDTTYSTYTLVRPNQAVTIGRPISGSQAYVLDPHGHPQPIGIPGELYLAGAGLARGYYGRPDLTAERFVPNHLSPQKNSRMYRTGDLCRWLPDGNLDYLGRSDHQVKVRGFRIELGEIEGALERHPSVRQAVVAAREDRPGDKRLVAYVVLSSGVHLTMADVREHLKRTLPDYMLPAALVELDAFPLTPNGKVDRKRLPAPESEQPLESSIAPRSPVEEIMAGIWTEVLGVPSVGVHDDFFTLGGHSLLATRVISRIRDSFQVDIPLKAIFESPRLEDLAKRVQTAKRGLEIPPLTRTARATPPLASFAQQRLWFLDQLQPNNPLYNLPWTWKIRGHLDQDAVESSLQDIVARHESLRTSFEASDGQALEIIHRSCPIPFQKFDLRHLPQEQREREARKLISEDANAPFDLHQAPLVRALLLRVSEDEHALLINTHHIATDGWSLGILAREFGAFYVAAVEKRSAELAPLPLQYADYAAWQRQYLQGKALESQLAYWKEQLQDAPQVLELPTDRPRQAMESFHGDVVRLALSRKLTDGLSALGRDNGATLYMTLLAGFQALLSRYSGQDDILVGSPIANRQHPDLENLIGLFVNTLALRTRLTGDPDFLEILSRVKQTALAAYAHQDMPFEKLVEELKPERSLSHSPLVQVFFALQNVPREDLEIEGLAFERVSSGLKTVKGDMYLSLTETAPGLEAYLEYNTDLFDRGTAQAMLEHFQTLVEAAVGNPQLKLSELPILTGQERNKILGDWNATEAEYPRAACLHEIFELEAERLPNAIACIQAGEEAVHDRKITYQELNQRANQLAHALRKRGAGPGKRIGIFMERSIEMMVGLLGIQKSGAAYVPLDPAYPAERIRLTLEDAQLALVVTRESLWPHMPGHHPEALCLDRPEIDEESVSNPGKTACPEDIVYVIFTSGSTGRPKGVEVPHRAVVNLLHFMGRELGMGPDDVFPALASFAFDMCIPELYLALVSGGRVVIGGKDLAANGEALSALLRRTGSTIIHATPTTWRLLLEAGFSGKGLKRVIGAEALPEELRRRLLAEDASLYNFYGPTETTVWSTWHHFTSTDEPLVVGRPISNTQVYILDQHLEPVPAGIYGEIYISGDGVARGYLNRPELTAEKFVPDPFASRADRKMYRTGDVGRFLSDGRIEFQGRADYQVKVRGFRIELGEIETVIGKHPAVNQNVVVAREDVAGDKRLVAYFVARPERRAEAAELRSWAKERLPEYMVPVAWVEMEKLPLSANGKVDRKQLPIPEYSRPELRAEYSRPRTPEEEILAGIWSEVLKVQQIGIEDDFFELGGHSLLATQVVSRIRQAFHAELPLRDLFEARTVAGLAGRIRSLGKKRAGIETAPIRRASRQGRIPLSFAQRRLWFLDQLEPGNPLYNVASVARVEGELNYEALEKSLNEIARRHESVRTTFPNLDREPGQAIASEVEIKLQILDASHLQDLTACESEARRLASEEIQRPFDLATGPLLRALAIRISSRDHALVLNLHHIISDRWSLAVLTEELAALYEAHLAAQPSPLPELEIQYADYAVWQHQFLSGDVLDRQLRYWRQKLEGARPVLEIPTDRPRHEIQQFWGAHHIQPLPKETTDRLQTLSRIERGTFYTSLLAGFELLMGRLAGQDDVVIGTDLANRNQIETEKLIGFFVNLLPIRARVDRQAAFTDFYQQIRETVLEAMTHQDIPFDKLVEELRPERSLSHNPLVQVLFVMQNTPPLVREFGGLKMRPLGVSSTSRFDLVVFINDPESEVSVTWMYNPTLFDRDRVTQMAHSYEFLLKTVSADPGVKLESLFAALDEFEREQRRSEQEKVQKLGLEKLKKARRKAIAEV